MKLIESFENEKAKADYVDKCERDFELKIDEAAGRLLEYEGLEFVTLSGPTCSGKTTAAAKLEARFAAEGRRIIPVSVDDFYIDRAKIDPKYKDDFDSIHTIDLELLEKVTETLDRDGEADIPIYDFRTLSRCGYRKISRKADTVILFEGIQALYPEVRSLFDKYKKASIYISVEDSLCDGKIKVEPERIRLIRRLVRDKIARNIDVETTLEVWDGVRKNEQSSIIPFKELCDIKLDSLLGYELSAIRDPLLKAISEMRGTAHAGLVSELRELMLDLEPISDALVPNDSLFREFIGH